MFRIFNCAHTSFFYIYSTVQRLTIWGGCELGLRVHFFNDRINWSRVKTHPNPTRSAVHDAKHVHRFFQVMCFTRDDATLSGARWLSVSWLKM